MKNGYKLNRAQLHGKWSRNSRYGKGSSDLHVAVILVLGLKARHLDGSTFCSFVGWKYLSRNWGGIPVGI